MARCKGSRHRRLCRQPQGDIPSANLSQEGLPSAASAGKRGLGTQGINLERTNECCERDIGLGAIVDFCHQATQKRLQVTLRVNQGDHPKVSHYLLKGLPVIVAVVLVTFGSYFLSVLNTIGFGIERNQIGDTTVVMKDGWFPLENSKNGIFHLRSIGINVNSHRESLLFVKPTLIFRHRPYITFSKFASLEKFYEKAARNSPFEKSITYNWGHADVGKQEIAGKGGFLVVVRESGLFITTDDLNSLDDIVSITTKGQAK
jgi:hypothetical protein